MKGNSIECGYLENQMRKLYSGYFFSCRGRDIVYKQPLKSQVNRFEN
jgi:hypothetical protein